MPDGVDHLLRWPVEPLRERCCDRRLPAARDTCDDEDCRNRSDVGLVCVQCGLRRRRARGRRGGMTGLSLWSLTTAHSNHAPSRMWPRMATIRPALLQSLKKDCDVICWIGPPAFAKQSPKTIRQCISVNFTSIMGSDSLSPSWVLTRNHGTTTFSTSSKSLRNCPRRQATADCRSVGASG
jgi:hypothetical protein